jgi:hypothetical protein
MGTKEFEFSGQDLAQLLTHYTDGLVPMNGEVTAILQHPQMVRKIGLAVRSDEWDTIEPLFLQYDGKRVASWTKADGGEPTWQELNETPNRQ